MFLKFSSKKSHFETRSFFISFVSVFWFVRDFKWKRQEFLRNWKKWSKRDQLPCDFEIFNIFIKFLNFGNLEISEFWWNRHEIDLQRTVFGRSFENTPYHIVIHQKLLSKDENFIWKGRDEWLWWFRSIIRRIFVFRKLSRRFWRKNCFLSMDSALKSIFEFPLHPINAFSILAFAKMIETEERVGFDATLIQNYYDKNQS